MKSIKGRNHCKTVSKLDSAAERQGKQEMTVTLSIPMKMRKAGLLCIMLMILTEVEVCESIHLPQVHTLSEYTYMLKISNCICYNFQSLY